MQVVCPPVPGFVPTEAKDRAGFCALSLDDALLFALIISMPCL